MRVLIASDVWKPMVNGLVTITGNLTRSLRLRGHEAYVLHPGEFRRVRCPWYPDVNLALDLWNIGGFVRHWRPNYIHIASEGPIGLAARQWATRNQMPYTTAIHTRMDLHMKTNLGIPIGLVERYMRWFHSASSDVLVHTTGQLEDLRAQGYRNLSIWTQGVDLDKFKPLPPKEATGKYLLYVGRISAEKDIGKFLDTPTQLRKVVVGDGPLLPKLRRQYPEVEFTGVLRGARLHQAYAKADALVMPSSSETLGLVMLEALACGVPVAAYPVTGPLGVIENGVNGWLDEDLSVAVERALQIDRAACRRSAEGRDYAATVEDFLRSIRVPSPIRWNGNSFVMQPSPQSN